MWLIVVSVLSVCSALNVRFEDTQGRPMQPIHREEYIYKNINGRMHQFPVRQEDTPSWGKTGHGREVYIRYILNPPENGQFDDNMNVHNNNNFDNHENVHHRHESHRRADELDPQSEESKTKEVAEVTNEQYTNQNERSEPEYAMDNLQNDQPILSNLSPRNNQVSTEQLTTPIISTTPRTHQPDQRSSTNNKRQKNSSTNQRNSTTKSIAYGSMTTRKYNKNVIQSTTERLISRGGTKDTEYSKSTRDNEVTPTEVNRKDQDGEGDRWVWPNGETVTPAPTTNVTFEDRASFTGDHCPTGKIRFNGKCVDFD